MRRLLNAFECSAMGLAAAWHSEAAFRQECFLALVLVPLGLWLGENGTERAILVGAVVLVLIVELLNSAVEAAVDRIGPDYHPLSKRAKDMGSAAVLFALVGLAAVWGAVLA